MTGYLEQARRGAFKTVAWQALATLGVSILALALGGLKAGGAVLLGGLIGTVASLVLVVWVFAGRAVRDPQMFLLRLMLGEMSKFVVAVVLFIIAFGMFKAAFGPLMLGYLATLVTYWVGLFKSNIGQAR